MYLKTRFAQMYLKTRVAQRQSYLASPLLAWRLNFVEPDECGACGVVVVAPSFITALLQQFSEHLVLSVSCLPSYGLLTRPENKKGKLID